MSILSKRLCIFAVASHAEARIEITRNWNDCGKSGVASHAEARIEIGETVTGLNVYERCLSCRGEN